MRAFAEWLEMTSISQTIQSVSWIVPTLQSIHILTIGVVFVSSLMIALRVIGTMRADEPFALVWGRFAPWMWSGLAVMLVSGLILVVGEPVREVTALSFWLKMGLIVVAAVSTVWFGRALRPSDARLRDVSAARKHGAVAASSAGARIEVASTAESFSVRAKLGAAALIVVWLAIIFLGRAIAYDQEVWGSLSLHA